MPHLRLTDDRHKRFDISRREKNIRPRVVVVQDLIESRIDDRS